MSRPVGPRVETPALVHGREEIGERADRLGRPEQQKALGIQAVVKERDHPLLQRRAHVNENVATADQVEPRERRVLRHVVDREHAEIADALADLKARIRLDEESAQLLGRELCLNVIRIRAHTRFRDRGLADVRPENLDERALRGIFQRLEHADRDGIHLLAGGTAGHPNSQRFAPLEPRPLDEAGDHRGSQRTKRLEIAKKACDVDQDVFVHGPQLGRTCTQELQELLDVADAVKAHPSPDSPPHRALLVFAQIDADGAAQQPEDLCKLRVRELRFRKVGSGRFDLVGLRRRIERMLG
jgi:hypothetical protein